MTTINIKQIPIGSLMNWLAVAMASEKRAANNAKHTVVKKCHEDQVKLIDNLIRDLGELPDTPLETAIKGK